MKPECGLWIDENTASVHFYQKHGFQVIEKSMDEHTKHDEFHMTWLKEK